TRQFLQQSKAFLDESRITPSRSGRHRFACPVSRHLGERAEGVQHFRSAPQKTKQPRNDDILLQFRHLPECSARLATLQEHRVESNIGFEDTDCRITVPKAQPLKLV